MDDDRAVFDEEINKDAVTRFTESYASFDRVINSLQRRYLELQEESSRQNEKLAEANSQLVKLTRRNLAATGFLNGILNSISAGVIAVDQNGRITHFNPAASLILSISTDDALGQRYRNVVTPGTPADANAMRAAESGREVASIEKAIKLADGTRLYLSVSTAVLSDDLGRSIGAVEVFQDLTKIKKLEQEVARLNTLAALGEMAATIAHEVRNPLSGIVGFASLLEKELAPTDPRKKLAGRIIEGVNNLNETVTTLLNYTRLEEVNRTQVVYDEFLRATLEQFRREFSDRIKDTTIRLYGNPEAVPIGFNLQLDRLLIRQVLFNVLLNAVDAGGEGGVIEVRYRCLSRETAASHYSDQILLGLDETVVETTITDNGPGISPEHLDRIFAPFFTMSKEGNGLGLAVAWKIMKAHGGDITADNGPAGGAVIHLLLPARIDHAIREQAT
ncbi:MAG: ATP-binding protein [bacterium]